MAPCPCRRWSTGLSCGGTGPAALGTAGGGRRRRPEVPGGREGLAIHRLLRPPGEAEAPDRLWAAAPGRPAAAALAGAPEAGALAAGAAAALGAAAGAAVSAEVPGAAVLEEEAAAAAPSAEAVGAAASAAEEDRILLVSEYARMAFPRLSGLLLLCILSAKAGTKPGRITAKFPIDGTVFLSYTRNNPNVCKGSEEKSRQRDKPQRARMVEKGAEDSAEHGLGAAHRLREHRIGRDGSARYSAGVCWYPLRPRS